MPTTIQRLAAGAATLALAFATVAGTELPATADARPAAPLSALPQGGVVRTVDTLTTATVSLGSMQQVVKKKRRSRRGPRRSPSRNDSSATATATGAPARTPGTAPD